MVANHNSAIDPYLFGAIPIENCFVTSWPFKIPVYGPLMKLAGYINIADGWENIFKQCTNRLNDGVSITIWPEGHRSRNGEMSRFRKGAFQLAVKSGYPIQPVCIMGSADIMSPGDRFFSPGRVKLILLDPLYPDTGTKNQKSAISQLRKRTIETLQHCLKKDQDWETTGSYHSESDSALMNSQTFKQRKDDVC